MERCCSIRSTTRSSTCGQIEALRSAAGRVLGDLGVGLRGQGQLGAILDRDHDLEVPLLE